MIEDTQIEEDYYAFIFQIIFDLRYLIFLNLRENSADSREPGLINYLFQFLSFVIDIFHIFIIPKSN